MTTTTQTPEFAPGTPVVVRPHGNVVTDAVITGTRPFDTPAGFVYEYRRESNGAEGIILPALTHRRIG